MQSGSSSKKMGSIELAIILAILNAGGIAMIVDTNAIISITEVNQNFSTATRLADKKGKIIIMENNKPAYILTPFREDQITFPSSQEIEDSADKFLEKYSSDFKKMAE